MGTEWHEGNGEHGLVMEFSGDGQRHVVNVPGEARLFWDATSRVLTVRFENASEAAATELFWGLLTIVPALRDDRR